MLKGLALTRFAFAMVVIASLPQSSQADVLYSTDFNAPFFAENGLIGQEVWAITGTILVNPLTIANSSFDGNIAIANKSRVVKRLFTPAVITDSIFLKANIAVSATLTTGDYFIHLGEAGSSTIKPCVYAKSPGTGFQRALGTDAGTATYGTAILDLRTKYTMLARYDLVTGTTNETVSLLANRLETFGVGDTPNIAVSTVGVDSVTLSSFHLRQGTVRSAPTMIVDNISVSINPVPEPSSIMLLGIAAVAGISHRGRRRNSLDRNRSWFL